MNKSAIKKWTSKEIFGGSTLFNCNLSCVDNTLNISEKIVVWSVNSYVWFCKGKSSSSFFTSIVFQLGVASQACNSTGDIKFWPYISTRRNPTIVHRAQSAVDICMYRERDRHKGIGNPSDGNGGISLIAPLLHIRGSGDAFDRVGNREMITFRRLLFNLE